MRRAKALATVPEVILADQRFLAEDAQHTFLIRHSRETLRSFYQELSQRRLVVLATWAGSDVMPELLA